MSNESNTAGSDNITLQDIKDSNITIVKTPEGRTVIQEQARDLITANFKIDAAVYGREDECKEVLQALRGEWSDDGAVSKEQVWLLSAGSSFGKTYLATKVLQEVVF